MSIGRGGIGIGLGGLAVLGLLSLLTGQSFLALLEQVAVEQPSGPAAPDGPVRGTPDEERLVDFVSFVLDDAQTSWQAALPGRYRDARLVLFTDAVRSACGMAGAAMGPFYCPADERVYVDLGFYRELRARYGAPGDFAQAYVVAHEIGHHVQHVLGIAARVRERQRLRPDEANALSVRLELQADCLAGVWAHATAQRGTLEPGDVEEGMGAAAAVGDDRLQRAARGTVQPERWTHGSSRQRAAWFRRGHGAGTLDACDTLGTRLPEDG